MVYTLVAGLRKGARTDHTVYGHAFTSVYRIRQEAYLTIRQISHQSRPYDFESYSGILGHGKLRDITRELLFKAETGAWRDRLDTIIMNVNALQLEFNQEMYGRQSPTDPTVMKTRFGQTPYLGIVRALCK